MELKDMGLVQWSEVAVALQKAGFTPKLFQKIINCPSNAAAYQMLRTAYITLKEVHGHAEASAPLFGLPLKKFSVITSPSYDGDMEIRKMEEYKDQFLFFHMCISRRQFYTGEKHHLYSDATDHLEPNRRYCFEIIPVLENVKIGQAVDFLKQKSALFIGMEAISMLWSQPGLKNKIPKPAFNDDSNIISLPHVGNDTAKKFEEFEIPCIVTNKESRLDATRDYGLDFLSIYGDVDLRKKDYLLCVTECNN